MLYFYIYIYISFWYITIHYTLGVEDLERVGLSLPEPCFSGIHLRLSLGPGGV